jgi:hypothetical protein
MYNYILLRDFLKNKENESDDLKKLEKDSIIEKIPEDLTKNEDESLSEEISETISLPVEMIKIEDQTKKSSIKKIKILTSTDAISG